MNLNDVVKIKHNAITAMIIAGKHCVYKILAIITYKIIHPCGRCGRFMYQINYDISIVG